MERSPSSEKRHTSRCGHSGQRPRRDAISRPGCAEEFIGLIADQAQEVALIVEDPLVAGRLDSDTLTLKPITFDLAEETVTVLLPWRHTGSTDVEVTFAAGELFASPIH